MSTQLREILAIHFDPLHGSPYWLRRQQALGFDVQARISRISDLPLLGPFDLAELSRHPVTAFVPQSVRARERLVLAETGGTTGTPRSTAFSEPDFDAAFITPFIDLLHGEQIFDTGQWLWLGPGGPHIIGKAAQRIAMLTTHCDAFSVDFDPRWFRRLAAGSLARQRYLDHLLDQASEIVTIQDVRFLFSTPIVLDALAARMADAARARIRFVYLGGMPIAAAPLAALGERFPHARFLAGYGNSLFGVSHERAPSRPAGAPPVYLPRSERLIVRIVPLAGGADGDRLRRRAAPGERGQVVMHRLDRSMFLPCVMERDSAVRIPVSDEQDGLGDPQPLLTSHLKIDSGIY